MDAGESRSPDRSEDDGGDDGLRYTRITSYEPYEGGPMQRLDTTQLIDAVAALQALVGSGSDVELPLHHRRSIANALPQMLHSVEILLQFAVPSKYCTFCRNIACRLGLDQVDAA